MACLAGKSSVRKDYIDFIITDVLIVTIFVTKFVMIFVTMNVLVINMKIVCMRMMMMVSPMYKDAAAEYNKRENNLASGCYKTLNIFYSFFSMKIN